MNTNELTRTPECVPIAPLLPLLDTGGLTADEEQTIRDHLVGCTRCREQAAAYVITASALRRYAGLDAAPVPSSLVTIDDVLSAAQEDVPAPVRPTLRSAPPGTRRMLSGVAALAAVLLIAVLTQAIFSSRNGPGAGSHPTPFTSAALAHAIVAVGTADGIYAIHAATGTLAWRYPTTDPPQEKSQYGIGCLTSLSGVLYACSPDGVIAVDASHGQLLWSRAFPNTIPVPASQNASTFVALGLAVTNGTVYVSMIASPSRVVGDPSAYAVLALNAATGAMLWRYAADEPIRSAPAVGNGAVYVATSDYLESLRASDGTLLWRSPLGGGAAPAGYVPSGIAVAALTVDANNVYISARTNLTSDTGSGIQSGQEVYVIRASDGRHLMRSGFPQFTGADVYAPIADSGTVIVPQANALLSLDANTGGIVWVHQGSAPFVGPVLAHNVLYTCDWRGDTVALDPATGRQIWRTGTQGGTNSQPPAIAGGAVFSDGGTLLYALRADTGGVLWRFQTGGNLQITPPLVSP